MSRKTDILQYSFATPATFRLEVLGRLDPSWSEELEDAIIEYSCRAGECSETILTVRLIDQAALIGLLNRLYGLGFPLVSVECVRLDRVGTQ